MSEKALLRVLLVKSNEKAMQPSYRVQHDRIPVIGEL